MASDGSDAEGNTPKTPSRKTPKRANNRQIVRWNDEKLAYAFAEFRLAAQRHRIDIKKPLDDAAKTIAPFVTSDALIQQLAKRRTRYIRDLGEDESTKASGQSEKKTPRKRNFQLKTELTEDNHSSPTVETPSLSAKRTPRSAKRSSLQKIKEEPEADVPNLEETDPESEYTESPLKAKNKRVRAKKGSSTKKKSQPKPQDLWSDDEDEFVDEAGGVNTYVDLPSSPQSPGTDTPSKRTKSRSHNRQAFARNSAAEQGEAINGDTYGIQHDGKKSSVPDDDTLQSAIEVAGPLSFHGQDVDLDQHETLSFGYANFDNNATHAQLLQMSEQLQAMNHAVSSHGIALPAPIHHSTSGRNAADIFSAMHHGFHPGFYRNAMTSGYTMEGTNVTHTAPLGSLNDSSSPNRVVQSSPSPVRNGTAASQKVGSFSSTETAHPLSTNNTRLPASFTHSVEEDEYFTFGRVDSPSFEQFGGVINQAHDSFGFDDGDRPVDDGEDDTPARNNLIAQQPWTWAGY